MVMTVGIARFIVYVTLWLTSYSTQFIFTSPHNFYFEGPNHWLYYWETSEIQQNSALLCGLLVAVYLETLVFISFKQLLAPAHEMSRLSAEACPK